EAAQPDRDRATEPGIGGRAYVQGQFGLASGRVWLACEPVRLGAGQPGRYLVLGFAGLVRRGGCLVEVLPDSGLAPPGPDHAEPDQRAEPVRGGWADLDQDLLAQRDGLVPATGAFQHVRVLAAQADRERGDVVLVAERDARLQVPFGLGELPLARVDSGQVGVGAPGLVMVAPGQ